MKTDPAQDELALSSVSPHAVFPGRQSLYVVEVAKVLSITTQQVIDLVVYGDLVAINISASRLSSEGMSPEERRRVPRSHWRIPVSAYDAFLAARKSGATL